MSSVINGIKAMAPDLLIKYSVPGAAVSIVENNETVLLQGFGSADLETNKPVDVNTLFQVASISKTVTAFGILKLVKQNKLDLDLPVNTFLKKWKLVGKNGLEKRVTIRFILSHLAGLNSKIYSGYYSEKRSYDFESALNRLKIIIPPGKKFVYSGGGFSILQQVIEDVTCVKFEDYMQEVLNELRMSDSFFDWKRLSEFKNVATPYNAFKVSLPNYIFPEMAAAGLYSTISDMSNFLKANLSCENSVIGDTRFLDLMQKRVIRNFPTGLGTFVFNFENQKIVTHSGVNRGFRSRLLILPKLRSGVAVLTNSDNGENLIFDVIRFWINNKIKLKNSHFSKMNFSKKNRIRNFIESKVIDIKGGINLWKR